MGEPAPESDLGLVVCFGQWNVGKSAVPGIICVHSALRRAWPHVLQSQDQRLRAERNPYLQPEAGCPRRHRPMSKKNQCFGGFFVVSN